MVTFKLIHRSPPQKTTTPKRGEKQKRRHDGEAYHLLDRGHLARSDHRNRDESRGYLGWPNGEGGSLRFLLRDVQESKVGKACGVTIVSEMFFQNATTDASCCRKMLTMGKNCHANMLGKILKVSPFKENKALALQRSRAILARCSSLKK
ncbi:hypothetical protein RHGRI_034721 [Rhododendron griersonianum]|uniref:Prolamin-like domain-containing protein n=1 Tax=Rhododendron griersonianum TaxID=479676 RepID=A0AAV6I1S1_9ERIC|nr:hypothetical protein RHGRI_034721 [Rhododendron griersonianum]